MKLTTREKQIKLAEACGWTKHPDYVDIGIDQRGWSNVWPDYPNNLNSMHEAETICLPCDSDELRDKYAELLQEAVYRESEKRAWFSATAAQRFEALGQTLELWEAGE